MRQRTPRQPREIVQPVERQPRLRHPERRALREAEEAAQLERYAEMWH